MQPRTNLRLIEQVDESVCICFTNGRESDRVGRGEARRFEQEVRLGEGGVP